MLNVAMIGANLQGKRRGPVIQELPDSQLVLVTAGHLERAQVLADELQCEASTGWDEAVQRDDIDAVVICTPTHLHLPAALAAIENGKHVLCEKPLGLDVAEAEKIEKAARAAGVVLKCGFNHRHHPGLQQAHQWIKGGEIGEVMFARCRYGIGGRPGYENEWRADPKIVGGGHLLEHGIHAIDLFRWFVGDPSQVFGYTNTSFWDMEPLEDNAFALLRTQTGVVFSLHSSLTQWTNLFSYEIYGHDGYIQVEGLGGSYGVEKASLGKRDFTAPFSDQTIQYRGADRSWYEEWREFVAAVQENREPLANGVDGVEALRVVHAIYESAKDGKVVLLSQDQ
jgi:predicted dehydrogenase